MRIHDAIARADHRLWINLIGKTYTRSEVLEVVIHRRVAVAGIGSATGVLQRAIDSSNRIWQIGVEKAHVIVGFSKGWEKVVAKANVQSQLLSDLPVVLNVGRDRPEARTIFLHYVLSKAAFVDLSD